MFDARQPVGAEGHWAVVGLPPTPGVTFPQVLPALCCSGSVLCTFAALFPHFYHSVLTTVPSQNFSAQRENGKCWWGKALGFAGVPSPSRGAHRCVSGLWVFAQVPSAPKQCDNCVARSAVRKRKRPISSCRIRFLLGVSCKIVRQLHWVAGLAVKWFQMVELVASKIGSCFWD